MQCVECHIHTFPTPEGCERCLACATKHIQRLERLLRWALSKIRYAELNDMTPARDRTQYEIAARHIAYDFSTD